ncbi:MAG TPA: efflux RND transporter periplasmic adaptor subunit [Vicinamibacterales bacterium]|jgi:multidrug efflux system membrane fusion protein|nr:efflux RND transporter periplasmic adaptor subunit [Vicinamibacterales bacterium]
MRSTTVVLLAIILASCSAHSNKQTTQRASRSRSNDEVVPVLTAVVAQKAEPLDIAASGTAEAISSVQIHSQVTGQLSAVHFAEGQDVAKGEPLFDIDPRPFQAALAQAQAVFARDTAQKANAATEVARYKPLLDRGLISREQYDSYVATAAATDATTGADQAAIEAATLNLQFTRIAAPISGRAGSLTVHPGDLVRANDATPMVTINQMAPINVSFAVPGKLLDDIRRYQAAAPLHVAALIGGANGAEPRGNVTFIDNAVDPATGTIKLKARFDNAKRELWPGEFVSVKLQLTTEPHAVVAPVAAVQTSQNGQYVYVVKEDGTVEMRPVSVERTSGSEAVIASGLRAGETVVTDGQLRLTPGTHVAVRSAAGTAVGATK